MKKWKVCYYKNGIGFQEHISLDSKLPYLEGAKLAMDKVKEHTPNATNMTAQRMD